MDKFPSGSGRSQHKINEIFASKFPGELPEDYINFNPWDSQYGSTYEYEIIFEGALDEIQMFDTREVDMLFGIVRVLADDCQEEHETNLRINREDDQEFPDLGWSVEIYMLDSDGDRVGAPVVAEGHESDTVTLDPTNTEA